VSPKFLAIFAVIGVALYLLFANKVPGSTVITGSTAQPTPLSTAGGIGSLEGAFASLFSAAGQPATQPVVGPTAAQIAAGVPAGSNLAPDTSYLDGESLSQFYSAGIGTESLTAPTLTTSSTGTGIIAPTAPTVTTAGPNFANQLPFQQTLGSNAVPSLDATNLSIGYVPPPSGSTALDAGPSLDILSDNYSSLGSSLG
jgi:hypothetical protein